MFLVCLYRPLFGYDVPCLFITLLVYLKRLLFDNSVSRLFILLLVYFKTFVAELCRMVVTVYLLIELFITVSIRRSRLHCCCQPGRSDPGVIVCSANAEFACIGLRGGSAQVINSDDISAAADAARRALSEVRHRRNPGAFSYVE